MSDLPRGWALGAIPDLLGPGGVFSDGDWVESKDQDPLGEVRLIQLADVGEGVFRDRSSRFLTASTAERLACTPLRAGDVLVARMPDPLGRACIFPGAGPECVTVVDVCIVRPGAGAVDAGWLMWALNAPQMRSRVSALQAGTTRKRISRKNLAAIELPIPPLSEQRRIVAAIEEQFSRLDAADGQLTRARRSLDLLRAASLSDAVEAWPEVRVDEIAAVSVGSTPSRQRPELWNGRLAWVSSGEVSFERIKSTRETIAEQAAKTIHPPGTVLLAMIGEGRTRGQAAILDIPASHNQNSAAIRLVSDECLPDWLFYVFMARYEQTRRAGAGGQQPALNKARVEGLTVPLPPLGEQSRIIGEIEQVLSIVAATRRSLDAAQQRSAALRRSILERAFRGELVPQDPSDEPASVLLERIRAERAAQPKPRRTRRAGSARAS